jgi:hypothetical protein
MSATLSDRVAAIQATHGGAFERQPMADGTIVVRLVQSSGEVIAGTGATTADAVASLERRVAAFAAALAAGA